MKNEQDLAFDIGLAVDRSRDDAEIRDSKREQEMAALTEIIARSKSTARHDKITRHAEVKRALAAAEVALERALEPHELRGGAVAVYRVH